MPIICCLSLFVLLTKIKVKKANYQRGSIIMIARQDITCSPKAAWTWAFSDDDLTIHNMQLICTELIVLLSSYKKQNLRAWSSFSEMLFEIGIFYNCTASTCINWYNYKTVKLTKLKQLRYAISERHMAFYSEMWPLVNSTVF